MTYAPAIPTHTQAFKGPKGPPHIVYGTPWRRNRFRGGDQRILSTKQVTTRRLAYE